MSDSSGFSSEGLGPSTGDWDRGISGSRSGDALGDRTSWAMEDPFAARDSLRRRNADPASRMALRYEIAERMPHLDPSGLDDDALLEVSLGEMHSGRWNPFGVPDEEIVWGGGGGAETQAPAPEVGGGPLMKPVPAPAPEEIAGEPP